MASTFPPIAQKLAIFEGPDLAKLAAEERARQDAREERLRIRGSSGQSNVLSSSGAAEASQASRPEVPSRPRPARRGVVDENPSVQAVPEPIPPPTPQDSTISSGRRHDPPSPQDSPITISGRHRDVPTTSEAQVQALENEISAIKAEVPSLKEQLGIRNKELEMLKKRLGDTERKYQEAILDVQRSLEERQALEDAVGRLKREWEGARTARDAAEAQLAAKQMELVDALEQLRMSEERRMEERERRMEKQRIGEAVRVEARAREHEIRADAQRRLEETTRRIEGQRLVEEARREGRREGRRERKGNHITVVVKEKPTSSMAWSLITGRTP